MAMYSMSASKIKYISNEGNLNYTFQVAGMINSMTIEMRDFSNLESAYRRAVQIMKTPHLLLIDVEEY